MGKMVDFSTSAAYNNLAKKGAGPQRDRLRRRADSRALPDRAAFAAFLPDVRPFGV